MVKHFVSFFSGIMQTFTCFVLSAVKLFESFNVTACVDRIVAIARSLTKTAYSFVVKLAKPIGSGSGDYVAMLKDLNGRSCAA